MMMIKVWGRNNSLNVQKVILTLEEIGLPYERTDAGLHFGVVNTAEYRAINPNGRVPTIDDMGFTLWESNAIVRYLCARYSEGKLWPLDARRRADADRWMDWQQTTLLDPINAIFRPLVRKDVEAKPEVIEAGIKTAEGNAAVLDALLSERPWVSGGTFGMADCVIATVVHRWMHLPIERQPRPHLERWYKAICERPWSSKVLILPLS
jgi:glutathione S-transferase